MVRGLGPVAMTIYATVLALVLAAAGGCSSQSSSDGDADETTRASYLIEKKQYSEAIYILNDVVKKQPGDIHSRTLLASAYAARAGIRLSSYVNFATELEKWNKVDELMPTDDDQNLLQVVARATIRIQVVIKSFDALPTVSTPDQLNDLLDALHTLDLGGQLHGGPALYRALLRVAVFKQNLLTAYRPQILKGCRISSQDLTKWLQMVGGEAGKIIDDVASGVSDAGVKSRTLDLGLKLKSAILAVSSAQLGVDVEVPGALRKVYGTCE